MSAFCIIRAARAEFGDRAVSNELFYGLCAIGAFGLALFGAAVVLP